MKLNLILEVFNKPSMDGIEITQQDNDTGYSFQLKVNGITHNYEVLIYQLEPLQEYLEDNGVYYTPKNKYGNVVSISLQMDDDHKKTNLNNQFEVYPKLISCIHHYVKQNKPALLKFSGYTPDMELVYDRMLRMANKLWPEDSYVPVSEYAFIRKEIHEELMNDEEYKHFYSDGVIRRKQELKTNRAYKDEERKQKLEEKRYQEDLDKVDKLYGKDLPATDGNTYKLYRYSRDKVIVYQEGEGNNLSISRKSFNETILNGKPLPADELRASSY